MKVFPRLHNGGTKAWTPVILSEVMNLLLPRSSVRSQVQTTLCAEPAMRCYVITCDLYRPNRRNILTDHIRQLGSEWEHPHEGLWLLKTSLSAGELRSAILPYLHFNDRIFICEAGRDRAEFNVLPSSGGKVMQIEYARKRSRILEGIFSRNGQSSRHLKAATPKSLRSA